MQQIRIDFDNPGLPQSLGAVEGESQSRIFQAALYKSGAAYTAPAGAVYSIMYRGFGPQNQGWYDTIEDGAGKRAACTVSGNIVTCELARQALRVPGHLTVVLCLTDAKGYMLKSWPIMADVRNDGYEDTVEVESFFYITQITSAEWTKAFAAWEDFKATIDPTLTLSGKAADAKATGAAVNKEKERASEKERALENKKADKTDLDVERKRIDTLNEGGLNLKDEVIDTSIKAWLTEHPEATTTVQDGSIGYEKLSESFKEQIISVISKKDGDISELIKSTLKSNVHLRICSSNITLPKTLSFENLENATLELIDSKIQFLYDHSNKNDVKEALKFENCKNILIKGIELTTDFSVENDESLDVQDLYSSNTYAIWFDNVENGRIQECTISQFTDGLSINASKNISVYRCTIYNVGQEPAVFRNCERCEMRRCEAYWHGGDGTIVKHWDSYALSGFVYAENYLHDGKVVTFQDGRTICGGGFTSNVEGNTTIKRDPEYIVVKNNIFIDTEYGVLFAGGHHLVVDGNFVRSKQRDDGSYYTYAAMGLDYSAYNLPSTQKYYDIKFINNTIENGSRGIYISVNNDQNVTITHENILISGNIIENCQNEALETHNSFISGNIFKDVQWIILYDSILFGNKIVGTTSPNAIHCRLQLSDSDMLCNRSALNSIYLDIRSENKMSVAYNTFDEMSKVNLSCKENVYFTKNTFYSTPVYNIFNDSEKYFIIDGEPYKKDLIRDQYFSYTKKNGVVELDFISASTPHLTTSTLKIGTLPDGYRPYTISRHVLYTNPSGGGIGKLVRIEVEQNGDVIAIANETIDGTPIRGTMTFLAEKS